MPYLIFTDSASNLPAAEVGQIQLIPWTFWIDGQESLCPLTPDEFDGHDFYSKMAAGAKLKTSLLNPGIFCDHFRPWLEKGYDILYVSLSSGVSGTYQALVQAAELCKEEFPQRIILPFDGRGAGLGTGIQALRAEELRLQGKSIREVYDILVEERSHICEFFTVGDLMYLKSTGRISAVSARVGTMLGIKPLLYGSDEGKIETKAKCRGRKGAVQAIVDKYRELAREVEHRVVAISHGDCLEKAQDLARRLTEIAKPKKLILAVHEPLTGAHVGPGMLAAFFYGEHR